MHAKLETKGSSGPRYLNRVGQDADCSRALIDVLCDRVVRPAFDGGRIPGRVCGASELVAAVGADAIVRDLVSDFEWAEVCQRLNAWQDAVETRSGSYGGPLLARILDKARRFPTVQRV